MGPYLFQFQILRSGEKTSISVSIVPEAGEIPDIKTFKSPRIQHKFTLNPLQFNVNLTIYLLRQRFLVSNWLGLLLFRHKSSHASTFPHGFEINGHN
jgi:hypothetical protein